MAFTAAVKPHVAVVASPGLGHVIPLLELAKLLVLHHGLHVTFLNITTTGPPSAAVENLLRSPSLPPGLAVVDLPPVDPIPPGSGNLSKACLLARLSFHSLSSALLRLHPKPLALVVDLLGTDCFDICRPLSIPVYSFYTTSSALTAFCLYLPTLHRQVAVEREFVDLPGPVKVPGCAEVRTSDLLEPVLDRKSDDYEWCLYHTSRLVQAAGILENSWEDLEPVPLRAMRENRFYREINTPWVYPVGPIIIKTDKQSNNDNVDNEYCIEWLDKQPDESVLFVALGSVGTLTAGQLTELAWGLELSRQRFLLVARRPSDVSVSATIYSAGGDGNDDPEEYLPEGFVARTEGLGLVVASWAPQSAVLGHGATGAFLSHCGWNSALESLANGVPMIAWPMYAEQKMNAAMLEEELGVAARPEGRGGGGVVGREEIARVVRRVMEGEEGREMRRRTKEYKESAARALAVGGSSHDALSRVVNEWKLCTDQEASNVNH